MGGVLTAEIDAKTSSLPFGALLTGAQSWGTLADELKLSNTVVALGMAVALLARRRMVSSRLLPAIIRPNPQH
jgi:hypothetical protein